MLRNSSTQENDQAQQLLKKLRGRASALDLTARLYRKMGEPQKLLELMTQSVRAGWRMDLVSEQIEAIAKDPELVKKFAQISREMKPDEPETYIASFIVADMAMKSQKLRYRHRIPSSLPQRQESRCRRSDLRLTDPTALGKSPLRRSRNHG